MAGHSHWAGIKHKKGRADKQRSKIFSKISKEITVAAKLGDKNPDMNPRLRSAIQSARSANMPKENIERAIDKSTNINSSNFQSMRYEGFGPKNIAVIVEALTDNKNRTAAEVRSCFSKNGGNLAESGAVSWNFETKGVIDVNADKDSVEDISMEGIDAGAIDVDVDESNITFYTTYQNFENVKKFLESNDSVNIDRSEIELVPNTFAEVDKSLALKTMKLLEKLEDLDDVQKVFSNLNITNELIDDFE